MVFAAWLRLFFSKAGQFFRFLIENWKATSVVILVVGNLWQWNWYWPDKVQDVQDQLDKTTLQLTACETSRLELKQSINLTNSQIDKWAKVSAAQQQSLNTMSSRIDSLLKEADNEVDEILAGPTPETCQEAFELLTDAVDGDLKW